MSFDLKKALATSPHHQKLMKAVTLVAQSRYVDAASFLEKTIADLIKSGATLEALVPFRQLYIDSLSHASARFASSSPYSVSRVDLRVRIDFLEQVLEQYAQLKDTSNQAHTLVALGVANLSLKEPVKAMHQFKQAFKLATPTLAFNLTEVQTVFSNLADALYSAFVHFGDHRNGGHYALAVESAAYRYLAGQPEQAMGDLEMIQQRYVQAAETVHRTHTDDARAFRLLVQGIYWGLATGNPDVLEKNADLLVNYAAQVGDVSATAVYDRSIALRLAGEPANAQRLVMMEAKKLLAGFSGSLDLALLHDIIDEGAGYQLDVADHGLKGGDVLNSRTLDLVDAKRKVALVLLARWAQTLNGIVLPFSTLEDRKTLEDFVSRGFQVSLQKASVAFGDATRQGDLYRQVAGTPQLPPMTVEFVRFIHETRWQDPESARLAYAQLAVTFQCTPAEVELMLSPRGADTPAVARIRAEFGDHNVDRMRWAIISRGLKNDMRRWMQDRDVKGRR